MANTMADSHSNRAAVQATNDDASASKLYSESKDIIKFGFCWQPNGTLVFRTLFYFAVCNRQRK
ncbi:hypothetical protein CK203_078929 [Vitis vinifera]|uniref:Uncharacterized protein n=1 Tax=Vitis vinifera TaxID=29760 RepID=A0A438DA46_VITVI|nr:hypothetical protein CK203_078929 [Vitis vinifera]